MNVKKSQTYTQGKHLPLLNGRGDVVYVTGLRLCKTGREGERGGRGKERKATSSSRTRPSIHDDDDDIPSFF